MLIQQNSTDLELGSIIMHSLIPCLNIAMVSIKPYLLFVTKIFRNGHSFKIEMNKNEWLIVLVAENQQICQNVK